MTKKTFRALRDCMTKIKGVTPTDAQIKEMFSLLSKIDRLANICEWEGPLGLRLEARDLPATTAYEKAFRESVLMWMDGASVANPSDHAAEKYFKAAPAGYDAAIFFAAVFSVGNILQGELAYSFIDKALQNLLPDGWRWYEEDKREAEAHKDDPDWYPILHSHRKTFLGDPEDEIRHRFDDIKICTLITKKDPVSVTIGKRIADRLPDYADGALQLILKELTYQELEKVLYILPESAEDRIVSNLSTYSTPIIKGNCIINKDAVSALDIRMAALKLEEAMNAYKGDPALEAAYEH